MKNTKIITNQIIFVKNKIVRDLKKYIRLGLESRVSDIINNKDKISYVTKRDIAKLLKYMNKINKHHSGLLEYIYVKSNNDTDKNVWWMNNSLLIKKCETGELEVVKFLLSDEIREKYPNIDPSANNNETIGTASYFGIIKVIKFLLSKEIREKYPNIDPSANDNYAIRMASYNGYIEVIRFLLSDEICAVFPSIDPSAENNCAIRFASENGYIEIVKLLLRDQRVIKKGLKSAIESTRWSNDRWGNDRWGNRDKILSLLLSIDTE